MVEEKAPLRRTKAAAAPAAPVKPKRATPKKTAASKTKAPASAGKNTEWSIERISSHIRDHAYHLWEAEGRPHGRDMELWLRAEKEVLTKIVP